MEEAVKRRLPSMSKSALLLSPCLAWTAAGARQYDDRYTNTTKRDRGTRFHAIIAGEAELDPAKDDLEMHSWVGQARSYLLGLSARCESVMAEVAVGANFTTGEAEVLAGVKNRDYPDIEGWTFGTADLVCRLKDGGLLVADWKTGGTDGAEMQLLSLACALQKAMPSDRVSISCLKVGTDTVWANEREVSKDELSIHWGAMRMAYEGVQNDPGRPYAGIHCTTLYCPHLAFCEAVGGVVRGAASGPQSGLKSPYSDYRGFVMTDRFGSDDHAGWVAERTSAAKRQLDYYTNALREYVANGGKVISGAYEWGPGPGGHRWRKR